MRPLPPRPPAATGTRRRGSRRCWRAAPALAAVLLLVSSCGGDDPPASGATAPTAPAGAEGPEDGAPQRGGTLTMAIDLEPTGLSPQSDQWTSTGAFHIANALFDPLVAVDADGNARPYLAESLTPNDTFTEWTITLRPGVTFHNGDPFDAAALKANLDATKASLAGALLGPLESTEVTGPLTAVVTLSTPWAQFPHNLARQPGYMVAPAMLADEDGSDHPIGTGPFVLDRWTRGSALTVTRNPDYWQEGLPLLDSVTFSLVEDPTSRLNTFTSGGADVAVLSSAPQVRLAAEAAEAGHGRYHSDASLETDEQVLLLNTTAPPFDDPRARAAVASAIDRDAIEAVTGLPSTVGPFQEGSPYHLTPEEAGWPAFDPARAASLAADYEAEHGRALAFTLLVVPDSETQEHAQLLQGQLAAAGIEMDIDSLDFAAQTVRLLGGDYQAAVSGFLSAPTVDQSYPFFQPPSPGGGISLNFTGLDDPDLVAALDAARATGDPSAWVEHHALVQRRMAANLDRLFLVSNVSGLVYADDVHGVTDGSFPGSSDTAYAGTVAVPLGLATWRSP